MKKNNLTIILFATLLMISGCNKLDNVDNPKNATTSPSITSDVTEVPTITDTRNQSTTPTISKTTVPTVSSNIKQTINQQEQYMEAYKKFMKNETKVSFDLFMPKNDIDQDLYKKRNEYTLSEVLDIVTEYYCRNSTGKKIKYIEYAYIDCGKDGVNELALRFNGMNIYNENDNSTLVYIIKYIDKKLSLCYYYETWARCESSINKYGYFRSSGSNGASNHSTEYSFIDKDCNLKPIVYIESETNINQFDLSAKLGQIPKVAKKKGISCEIEVNTIYFDNNENLANSVDGGNKNFFYTFYAYDNKGEPIKDLNLYTKSIYKEIFDESLVPFITPDEVSNMISEKEEKVGATAEIKEGNEVTWKTLRGNIFSEYLESLE